MNALVLINISRIKRTAVKQFGIPQNLLIHYPICYDKLDAFTMTICQYHLWLDNLKKM